MKISCIWDQTEDNVHILMVHLLLRVRGAATLAPILQALPYITAHSPTLLSLYQCHSSFSDPSTASPTSQLILQPLFRFSYVTWSSFTLPGELPMIYLCMTTHTHTFQIPQYYLLWLELLYHLQMWRFYCILCSLSYIQSCTVCSIVLGCNRNPGGNLFFTSFSTLLLFIDNLVVLLLN